MKEVCELLAKLDPHLSVIAKNSKRENNKSPKKRKAVTGADDAQHIPKKKSPKTYDKQDSAPTLSQREDKKAMKNLTKHILECGGKNIYALLIETNHRATQPKPPYS